ncbi:MULTISPECIES: 5-oxoprolinase subunit B family protein [Pseudomonas]|uniref:Allophanate hydrolase subunit 1 n=1 Tax=Pseudomonas quercus TaxID=2722792 RepID=A0ABX0YCE8_9PSED|nr:MULTISPECIES: allophanate hydrolase subunit 1 [Pseudomonas]MBF7142496.1 allophanate hydrolase subunit 1 [Pseudomonas sp. LY10J]NJP01034.1 allophanate hydrolase subunit 1 [Pseudomonas quercus]
MSGQRFAFGQGQHGSIETVALDALMVRLFTHIDEGNVGWLLGLAERLRHTFGEALVEVVPSYTTVMVQYDILAMTPEAARQHVKVALQGLMPAELAGGREHRVPVWYDPSVGPDLSRLADLSGLAVEEVVRRHCAKPYRVFALGFTPGFAFMGLVEPALAAPRLTTPRQQVAAGSVGIGERQTAIYPSASPGGWNILGRTPVALFCEGVSLFQPGDSVQFEAITRHRFVEMGGDTTPLGGVA